MYLAYIGNISYSVQEKQRQMEQMNGGQMPDCQQVVPFQGSCISCLEVYQQMFS